MKIDVSAMPINWKEHSPNELSEDRYGFYITHDKEEEEPYGAALGEGDVSRFKTLTEAMLWCQEEIDRWVREVAVVFVTEGA